MKKNSRLDEILLIEEKEKRKLELEKYAKEFKINPGKAKKPDGELDEDELTVLIYDAEENKIRAKNQVIAIIVAAAIVLVIVTGFIAIFAIFFHAA